MSGHGRPETGQSRRSAPLVSQESAEPDRSDVAAASPWYAAWRLVLLQRNTGIEVAAVATITLIALVLRCWDLTLLPNGMHGDEAVAGLEAQRVLEHHWIGVYSLPAAGQPAGPLYLFALPIQVLGHTLLAVRVIPMLLGTVTVPLLYLVTRKSLGREVALAASLVLAVMGWHIHFARIGFPLEAWPLVTLLAVGAMTEAVRGGSWLWWAVAGTATSAGIYVYNSHWMMLLAFAVFLLGFLILHRSAPLMKDISGIAVFGAAALVVALPMLSFAASPENGYFDHFERDAITSSGEWKVLDTPIDKASFIGKRYVGFWDRLTFDPELDSVDATGIMPVVPLSMLVVAAFGVAAAVARRRTGLVAMGIVTLVVMPLASALTIDGAMRRTFMAAPFIALFCGVGLVHGTKIVSGALARSGLTRRSSTYFGGACGVLLFAVIAGQNVYNYFWSFRDAPLQEWVFATDFTDSVSYIHNHDSSEYVYYLSDRWSFNYEPRKFLAPEARGEDRSREFGSFHLDVDRSKGRPLFVLVGNYRGVLAQLEQLYPGGSASVGAGAEVPTFIAYELP